jgi:hypothetical protein
LLDTNDDIHAVPFLSIEVAYPKTRPGQGPFYSLLIAGNSATSALQASLIGKGDVSVSYLEAVGRANIQTDRVFAFSTDFFAYSYVPLGIDIVFVDSQFVFYSGRIHNALFI